MSRRYANARDVLPSELIALVQRHYDGLLWIPPPPPEEIVERNEQIQRMYLDGVPVTEIAQQIGLSERRVWQILR